MATVRGGDSRPPPATLTTVAAHVLGCEVLDAVPPVRVEVTDVERGARCDQTVAAPAPGVIAVPPGALHLSTDDATVHEEHRVAVLGTHASTSQTT